MLLDFSVVIYKHIFARIPAIFQYSNRNISTKYAELKFCIEFSKERRFPSAYFKWFLIFVLRKWNIHEWLALNSKRHRVKDEFFRRLQTFCCLANLCAGSVLCVWVSQIALFTICMFRAFWLFCSCFLLGLLLPNCLHQCYFSSLITTTPTPNTTLPPPRLNSTQLYSTALLGVAVQVDNCELRNVFYESNWKSSL